MNFKQVIVIRNDLKLGRGKFASQCCHASLKAFEKALKKKIEWVEEWKLSGGEKVVVKVENEEELLKYFQAAKEKFPGMPGLVIDAGRTQIPKGTKTCFAVGPVPEEEIDKITGKLKLA